MNRNEKLGFRSVLLNQIRKHYPDSDVKNLNSPFVSKLLGRSAPILYKVFSQLAQDQNPLSERWFRRLESAGLSRSAFMGVNTIRLPSMPIVLKPKQPDNLKNIYYPLMMDLIGGSQFSVRVGEFLGKGNNEQINGELDSYGEVHNELFKLIETKCGVSRSSQEVYGNLFSEKSYNFSTEYGSSIKEYTRVLYLSYDDSQVLLKKSTGENRSAFTKNGVLLCASRPLFEHICHCLKHQKEATMTATETNTAVNFYASIIRRPYLFAVVVGKNENDIYLVSEYYRYEIYKTARFLARPDLLYVKHITKNKNKNELYIKYHTDFGEAQDEDEKITLEDLTHFVKYAGKITKEYCKNMGMKQNSFDRFKIIPNLKIDIYNKIFQEEMGRIS